MLECRGLTKQFGSTLAVNSLDLSLQSGGPIALVGPNGAGKTTLLSLCCGFIRPSRGDVTLFGEKPGRAALHGKIAALPQDAQFDPGLPVARQLNHFARLQGLSRGQAVTAVAKALDTVQMSGSLHAQADELSHGMRKRVAIAQVLLGTPELALLDEPTAGLDPPNAKIIRDVVTQHKDQTTFIISSHNLDELERLCTEVVFLQKGALQAHKPIDAYEDDSNYLTVRLSDVSVAEFTDACYAVDGVEQVSQQQGGFVIRYDRQSHPALDIRLMEMMNTKGWQYKNLSRGRSLEDQLFGSDS